MNEQKPLRQEDYQAMAEENKRIKRAMEEMNKPKLKPKKKKKEWSEAAIKGCVILGILALLGVVLAWAITGDLDETNSKLICVQIAHYRQGPDPWDKYSLWKHTKGKRGEYEAHIDRDFSDYESAQQFLKKWHMPECK